MMSLVRPISLFLLTNKTLKVVLARQRSPNTSTYNQCDSINGKFKLVVLSQEKGEFTILYNSFKLFMKAYYFCIYSLDEVAFY